jgi:hypothetical protein
MSGYSICYFVTKELFAIDKVIQLCIEFNIPIQSGFYENDHYAILYDELSISFVTFMIVRRRWPFKIYQLDKVLHVT